MYLKSDNVFIGCVKAECLAGCLVSPVSVMFFFLLLSLSLLSTRSSQVIVGEVMQV